MSPITSIRRDVCPFWYLLIVCLVGLPGPASAQTAVNGTLLISEFRVRGPNGANDEFVEIYNNTNASHTVSSLSGTGYGLAASDGVTRCSIPNGTVIPARGHYLCVNSVGYSLGLYPAGSGATATGNATYTTDIPDNAGIALFNNNTGGGSYSLANRIDAVGSTSEANTLYKEGTGYPAINPSLNIDYSFTRKWTGGCTGFGTCSSVADHRTHQPESAGHQQQRHRLLLPGHQRHVRRRWSAAGRSGPGEPELANRPRRRRPGRVQSRFVREPLRAAESGPRFYVRPGQQLDVRDARPAKDVHQRDAALRSPGCASAFSISRPSLLLAVWPT